MPATPARTYDDRPLLGKVGLTEVMAIRNQWDEAADAARLTEADRRLLYGREILNEFIFRS